MTRLRFILRTWKVMGRDAFGWTLAFVTIVLLLHSSTPPRLRDDANLVGPLMAAATLALILPILRAAVRLIEMDRDGRLDHYRLSGVPPVRLLLGVLAASIGPAAVAAVALAAAATAIAPVSGFQLAWLIMLGGGAVAIVALVFALRWPGRPSNPQVLTAAVVLFASIAAAVIAAYDDLPPRVRQIAESAPAMLLAVAAVGAGIALSARGVLARARRSAAESPSVGGRVRGLWLARLPPDIARGVRLSAVAALLLAAVGLAATYAASYAPNDPPGSRDIFDLVTLVIPLMVGGVAVSIENRLDMESGRLDLIRASPSASVVKVVGGLWLPFVAMFLVLAALSPLSWRAVAVTGLVILTIAPPLSVLEGAHRVPFLVYQAPGVLLALPVVQQIANWLQWTAPPQPRMATVAAGCLLLAWVPWAAARGAFVNPQAPPLRGWTALAAVASIAAGVVCLQWTAVSPWLLLIVLAPWIDGATRAARRAAAIVVAGSNWAASVTLPSVISPFYFFPLPSNPLCAGLALLIGWRVHDLLKLRPMGSAVTRATIGLALVASSEMIPALVFEYWPPPVRVSFGPAPAEVTRAYQLVNELMLAGVFVTATAAVEALAVMREKRRLKAPTPPP